MIAVHDDIVADPIAYRAMALAQPFGSIDVGHAIFHGIALCSDPSVIGWLARTYPNLEPTLSFFRQSPEGQDEPNDIHTDVDMGDVTVIVYLNDPPAMGDGTSFWRHRDCRAVSGGILTGAAGKNRDAWECWRTVPAVFNRAVIFDAPLFHSRAIRENYGHGADARLIQVIFGTWREA